MPGRMRQRADEKLRPIAAYVGEKIYQQVDALARERRWSLSVAAGYLIEKGLIAARGQGELVAVTKPEAASLVMEPSLKGKKTK